MSNDNKLVSGSPQSTTFGTPGVENVVDPTWGAQRTVLKPTDFMGPSFIGGHYCIARSVAGVTGVAAGGALVSVRWAQPVGEVLIKRIMVGATLTTAFTTIQALDFDVIAARAFTASDTGGTAITPLSGNFQKKRTKLINTSQITDFRETAAGALVAGTKTLDSSAFGIGTIPNMGNTIGSGGMIELYREDKDAEHPMMFGNNEGFNIRVVTAMGAAGVIRFYYAIDWAEVPGL